MFECMFHISILLYSVTIYKESIVKMVYLNLYINIFWMYNNSCVYGCSVRQAVLFPHTWNWIIDFNLYNILRGHKVNWKGIGDYILIHMVGCFLYSVCACATHSFCIFKLVSRPHSTSTIYFHVYIATHVWGVYNSTCRMRNSLGIHIVSGNKV